MKTNFNKEWPGLMAAAQSGDKIAYGRLLREISRPLQGYLHKRIKDDSTCDDLVQTILLKIHTARHTFDVKQAFEPWFFSIARSVLIDFYRSNRRQKFNVPLDDECEIGILSESIEPIILKEVLASLDEEQQTILKLLKWDGLSLEEAAAQLGVSLANMKVKAHRTYKAFWTALNA